MMMMMVASVRNLFLLTQGRGGAKLTSIMEGLLTRPSFGNHS